MLPADVPDWALPLSEQIAHSALPTVGLPRHSVHVTITALSHRITVMICCLPLPLDWVPWRQGCCLTHFFIPRAQHGAWRLVGVQYVLKECTLCCPYKFNQTAWWSGWQKWAVAQAFLYRLTNSKHFRGASYVRHLFCGQILNLFL